MLVTARATSAAGTGVLPDNSPALVYRAVVTTRSARPIRNVSCRLLPIGQAPVGPAVCNQLMDYPIASARTVRCSVMGGQGQDRTVDLPLTRNWVLCGRASAAVNSHVLSQNLT